MDRSTYIAIGFGVILWIIYKLIDISKKRNREKSLKMEKDVKWFGPDISIKRKSYPNIKPKKPPDEAN